jgi:hypothetical protein
VKQESDVHILHKHDKLFWQKPLIIFNARLESGSQLFERVKCTLDLLNEHCWCHTIQLGHFCVNDIENLKWNGAQQKFERSQFLECHVCSDEVSSF